MSARSDSVSSYHIDDKVKAHSMKYQNLTPKADQELLQHMHLISKQYTSRDKKRKAERSDDDPAEGIPFVDDVRIACSVAEGEALSWEDVRNLDRNPNNFLYAWQPFHQVFDEGWISVVLDKASPPRQVECVHPKDGKYTGFEVTILITFHKTFLVDMSQYFAAGTTMISPGSEYQATVTVQNPVVFGACLAWKAQDGERLRSERANMLDE